MRTRGTTSAATCARACVRASTSSSSSSIPSPKGAARPNVWSIRPGAYGWRLVSARERLIAELRAHALILGEVMLTSGRTAQYYVDAKRAILRPTGFHALAELVAEQVAETGATAVGGLTMGADAPACAALAGGADVKAFFVRKETKAHGLQRRIEGPPLDPGERCLIVE